MPSTLRLECGSCGESAAVLNPSTRSIVEIWQQIGALRIERLRKGMYMRCAVATALSLVVALLTPHVSRAEDVLFEDDFERGLAERWQIVGLGEQDYRVRNGGLELRVQPGRLTKNTPMLRVVLPFTSEETVIASVRIRVLSDFTENGEFGGVYLLDDTGLEFGATKELVKGKLMFSPGAYRFVGQPGEEGNPDRYIVRHSPAMSEAGPLRIVVDRGTAFFQVGPSEGGEYRTFFHSAIRMNTGKRGFCLVAAGAPDGVSHWVRFEEFRVSRR